MISVVMLFVGVEALLRFFWLLFEADAAPEASPSPESPPSSPERLDTKFPSRLFSPAVVHSLEASSI